MYIAAKMLEDREFIRSFLKKSTDALCKQRLLAESLLDQAGIEYSREGFVQAHS